MDGDNKLLREFGKFRLDTGRKILWHDRKTVAMPLKELELLSLLVENQGKLVTKDELLEKNLGGFVCQRKQSFAAHLSLKKNAQRF